MKKTWIAHPLLVAAFPVLFLYAQNAGKFSLASMLTPMVISVVLAAVLWAVVCALLRNAQKAGLLVTAFLLLFFTYGHVWNLIEEVRVVVAGVALGPNKLLFPLWIGLLCVAAYLVLRTRRDLGNLTRFLNAGAAVLVLLNVVSLGAYALQGGGVSQQSAVGEVEVADLDASGLTVLPHIYYIILDGYARADVLAEMYEYDNGEMLDYLAQKGFYVASQSRSNYAQTALSLASSLNLEYLGYLSEQVGSESDNRRQLRKLIGESKVARTLQQLSYTIVAFATGYATTEITNADVYLSPDSSLNEFENGLLNTTPIPAVLSMLSREYQFDLHRERILYTLEHLADAAEMKEPAFVFAHIITPHPPFVFGRNGEEIRPEGRFSLGDGGRVGYRESYLGQLEFINGEMRRAIDDILARSTRPVVIIVQGDHGPGSTLNWDDPDHGYVSERMPILNAYLLPDGGEEELYAGISPVNTFRAVFNRCFGYDYDLLEDESYTSPWEKPYQFLSVDEIDSAGSDPSVAP